MIVFKGRELYIILKVDVLKANFKIIKPKGQEFYTFPSESYRQGTGAEVNFKEKVLFI